ncbi:MAG: MBL fold metallo-hydrolase [Pseudomonadota bacterium]
MKVKFWGVRGSIAAPGFKTARYGGNTTCIEIRTDQNELIILDAGTGLFPLSQALLAELPICANVFITHSHWDHIQGLPFFVPNFIPGNRLRLHGAFDPVSGKGVEQVMAVQLQYSYFPVLESEMKADIEYINLAPEQSVRIGSATITPYLLNHPVINFGYRIECGNKSLFFTGDHEPHWNIYEPTDEQFAQYQVLLEEKNQAIRAGMQGVDVLITDASYTDAEYPAKKGWGHGTLEGGMRMAQEAGARVHYCTHHEATRSDDELEAVFQHAVAQQKQSPGAPEYRLAREGDSFEF